MKVWYMNIFFFFYLLFIFYSTRWTVIIRRWQKIRKRSINYYEYNNFSQSLRFSADTPSSTRSSHTKVCFFQTNVIIILLFCETKVPWLLSHLFAVVPCGKTPGQQNIVYLSPKFFTSGYVVVQTAFILAAERCYIDGGKDTVYTFGILALI